MHKQIHSHLIFGITVSAICVACGGSSSEIKDTQNPESAARENTEKARRMFSKFTIGGAIVSAFQISVDGVTYLDSEDFYSSELNRLPSKVSAAGYEGWQVRFEAVAGFSDFARSMQVFVSPTGKSGYSGQTSMSADGKFLLELPLEAAGGTYNIRAVKRVNIIISKDSEVRKFCYNLSAHRDDLHFDEHSMPVILDNFKTRMTLYECTPQQFSTAMPLPASDGQSRIVALTKGISEFAVTAILGRPDARRMEIGWGVGTTIFQRVFWTYNGLRGADVNEPCKLYFSNQKLSSIENCTGVQLQQGEDEK